MSPAACFPKVEIRRPFIPHPITTGFTCGIAITIISTQVQDFFGLKLDLLNRGLVAVFHADSLRLQLPPLGVLVFTAEA